MVRAQNRQRLLTAAQLSRRLQLSRDQIYKLAASGRIPAHWFGQWRFDLREVLEHSRNGDNARGKH
jgi:excisionase family DNA binding protein